MERYTPGDAPSVTSFMARRTLPVHGAFFRPLLWPGAHVLDCGCGPGTITAGIHDCIQPGGFLAAIDANPSQIDEALQTLRGRPGVDLRTASVYELPFPGDTFDLVFSHALFEHLADPVRGARELLRVLRPGGIAALRSPDWDGKLAGPQSGALDMALEFYAAMQAANGGNLCTGKSLGSTLAAAGFQSVRTRASYECYEPVGGIAEYLARQMDSKNGEAVSHSRVLREWSAEPGAFFAQAWCETVARKPLGRDKES